MINLLDGEFKVVELTGEAEEFKVAGTTHPNSIRDAILTSFNNGRPHKIRSIGAGTLNTVVKGCMNAAQKLEAMPLSVFMVIKPRWLSIPSDDGGDPISGIEVEPIYLVKVS